MENGVLAVMKSTCGIVDLSNFILGFGIGKIGPITCIYSKGIQTTNFIVLLSRDLYDNILVSSLESTRCLIQSISPYLISDKQIPKDKQNTNIFLRFEHLDQEIVHISKIETIIRLLIDQLIEFGIINRINYNIFVSDAKHPRKIGSIIFLQYVSLDTAIYIRSLLNGHITSNLKINAYWCSDESDSSSNYPNL